MLEYLDYNSTVYRSRSSHLVVDMVDLVWFTWILIAPLPAQLFLGWWEFGKVAWQLGKMVEHSNQSQPYQVYDQMGQPVLHYKTAN